MAVVLSWNSRKTSAFELSMTLMLFVPVTKSPDESKTAIGLLSFVAAISNLYTTNTDAADPLHVTVLLAAVLRLLTTNFIVLLEFRPVVSNVGAPPVTLI